MKLLTRIRARVHLKFRPICSNKRGRLVLASCSRFCHLSCKSIYTLHVHQEINYTQEEFQKGGQKYVSFFWTTRKTNLKKCATVKSEYFKHTRKYNTYTFNWLRQYGTLISLLILLLRWFIMFILCCICNVNLVYRMFRHA